MAKRRRKARTAAQKAATARMLAAAAKRRRRSVPRRMPIVARPVQKRRSHPITPTAVASRAGRQLRYRRPNPVGGFFGDFIQGALMPAAIGGAGALGLDVVMGVLPLPEQLKSGPLRPVTRIAGAVALGAVASMITDRKTAEQIAAGALVVVLYDTMKGFLARTGVNIPGIGLYEIPGIGMYEVQPEPTIGYTASGMQVGDTKFEPDTIAAYVSGDDDESI